MEQHGIYIGIDVAKARWMWPSVLGETGVRSPTMRPG